MIKLYSILNEIEIRPFNLKNSIKELINSEDGGFGDLEYLVLDGIKNSWEDVEGEVLNPEKVYPIYEYLLSNPNSIKLLKMEEGDEMEEIILRGYKTLITFVEYPKSNHATSYLIFIK